MAERRVIVETEAGLHARPAALFVQAATRTPFAVTVSTPGKEPVNAKSILAVLALDVARGEEIVIRVDGEGADAVLDELAGCVAETGG